MNPLDMIKPFLLKHEPEILMSMGIAGLVFSTLWGVRATVKATKIVEDKKANSSTKVTNKDIVKMTWKLYIPVVVSAAVSIPCIIASNKVSNKRYAALATAYSISTTALQEYQDKVKEVVGDKKDKQIRDEISKDQVAKTYKGPEQIIITGDGDTLFFEPLSGRYFKSNWNKISKAANELNSEAMSGMEEEIRLNDWFDKLGLGDIELGENIGWNLRRGVKSLIDVDMGSTVTKDKVPCGVISYVSRPEKLDSY
jgi:hypothetical protein